MKQLGQRFSMVKLKSLPRKLYDRHHELVNRYGVLCHRWQWICSVCRNHNPVLFSFLIYHRFVTSNTMSATCGAEIIYPCEAHEFNFHPSKHPVLVGFVLLDLCLCVVFCRSLFVLLSFFLFAFLLYALLRFTASYYRLGIFKLLLCSL